MSTIKLSYFPLRDLTVATNEFGKRIHERWPDDPSLVRPATDLIAFAVALSEAFAGSPTNQATEAVEIADEGRDASSRAALYMLKAILNSEAHRALWEAASELLFVIAGQGMGWITESYNAQTLALKGILKKLAGMGPQIETCGLRVFVDQMIAKQAFFEEKSQERGQLVADRPDRISTLAPQFKTLLRSVLLLLETREDNADRAYVLEPFTRLRRRSVTPVTPENPDVS